jgi:hypothetical protein
MLKIHGMKADLRMHVEDGWEKNTVHWKSLGQGGGEVRVQRDLKVKMIEIKNTTQIILHDEG